MFLEFIWTHTVRHRSEFNFNYLAVESLGHLPPFHELSQRGHSNFHAANDLMDSQSTAFSSVIKTFASAAGAAAIARLSGNTPRTTH
jgi:hypothetical protein